MNVYQSKGKKSKNLADFFQVLGQPSRLQILFGLGENELCVCHLETLLGERQAYVSQELMLLKDAGLVKNRRVGRNIYYRLHNPVILDSIRDLARKFGQNIPEPHPGPIPGCPCPQCNPSRKDCLPVPSAGER
jgi:DNA-binding transcriptional ArsR family regulator